MMMSYRSILHCLLMAGFLVCSLPGIGTALVRYDSYPAMDEGVRAGAKADLVTRIRVMGDDNNPLTGGEIEFVKSGQLITRLAIGADGYTEIDHSELQQDSTYKIVVLNTDLDELYVATSWVYDPNSFDPQWDPELKHNKYKTTITLQGMAGGELSLNSFRATNPAWQKAHDDKIAQGARREVMGPPRFVGTASVAFMFGRFGADENAAEGVPEVDPGLNLTFGYRHGYPDGAQTNPWVSYRELRLSYAQNRYTTNQALEPGQSDVTFHRVTVSYGLGRAKGKHDVSAALAMAVGGIYDASDVLEYLDRTYTLFGFGVNARYIFTAVGLGKFDLGLMGQAELMYYPTDTRDNDHWFGLAPSIAIGVALY